MYELIKKDGRAKRGRLTTVHGVIETPVFMNVGTVAAIKGAVSTDDLKDIGTQVELSNTYHLHVRTGDKLIKEIWKSLSILNQFGQRTLLIMSCTPATRLKYLFTNRRSKIYSAYYIQAKRRIRYE